MFAFLIALSVGCRDKIEVPADDTSVDSGGPACTPADELCDGVDNDCDGLVDGEDDSLLGAPTWYGDVDGDGYGDPEDPRIACDAALGTVPDAEDCDDVDPSIHPDADEICNDVDDDCDSLVDGQDDSLVGAPLWHADIDGDGFGGEATGEIACDAPLGTVPDADDCDDVDPTINPDADEICNDVDDDCDGLVDGQDDSLIDAPTWYGDADGDGYGDPADPRIACNAPPGAVARSDDCDDTNASVHPDATELCENGVDEDCDGFGCTLASGSLGSAVKWTGAAYRYAGWAVAAAGDVDADGFDDVLVGAPGGDEAYLVKGSSAPISEPLSSAAVMWTAPDVGWALTGPGDVDGDGYVDVLIGGDDAAYLFHGGPTLASGPVGLADAAWVAEGRGDLVGFSMAGGDLDGDGFSDLVLGAQANDDIASAAGALYVVLGGAEMFSGSLTAADGKWTGEAEDDQAGTALACGDVDGDGGVDLVVGAPHAHVASPGAGAAYLLLGANAARSASLASADAQWRGEADDDEAGTSVAAGADLDADGYGDVLVGAPGRDGSRGAAYVIRGGATPSSGSLAGADALWSGEESNAGTSVASVGDADADGYADAVIGSPDGGSGSGDAYLVFGSATLSSGSLPDADVHWSGPSSLDRAGYACSGAGDFDGDGFADIVIAAYGDPEGGHNAGAAYLLLGESGY